MKKNKKQTGIEVENLLEEAAAVFDTCTSCGLCKGLCPAFKTILDERVSPRGHATTISHKVLEKAVFQCTMCKACEQGCPLNIKICDAVTKSREALALKNKSPKKHAKILENIKKTGTPFKEGIKKFNEENQS